MRNNLYWSVLGLGLLAVAAFGQIPPDQTGIIGGTVRSADGKAQPGAMVSVMLVPDPSAKFTPHNASTAVFDDGSFVIGALPPGTYRICVQPRTDGNLNTCIWPEFEAGATVAAGRRTDIGQLTLPQAFRLQLRLTDSTAAVSSAAKAGTRPPLFVDVISKAGLPAPMSLSQDTPTAHPYEIWAPYGTPLQLQVASPNLILATDSSNSAKRNVVGNTDEVDLTMTVTQGNEPGPILVNITGKK